MDCSTRTHRARFNCSKQFAAAKAVIAEALSGCAQGDDFRMSGGVVVGEVAIPTSSHDTAAEHDHGADGHFAAIECALGAAEGFGHPQFVGWVECRCRFLVLSFQTQFLCLFTMQCSKVRLGAGFQFSVCMAL